MNRILGFGMMRLPVKNGNPTDFDYEELEKMVDLFLENGYTYFDTSFVYHNGESEAAVRKALVERHPRDIFTVATKFPTFDLKSEDEIEPIFEKQLERLGVSYIDYYLLHNIQNVYYDGIDGTGGIMKKTNLFEHAKKWKADGRIGHLGISFHSSAILLDRILDEHPEIEFVQISINYIDWDSEFVQAKGCYEACRRHNVPVVCMEPVKGGGLAKLPEEAEMLMKEAAHGKSIASWAVRWCAQKEGLICVLSGMGSLEQVRDNIATMKEAEPLSAEENAVLNKAVDIYRENTPIPASEIRKYEGLLWNGVPVTAILQGYSICQVQPDPGYSDDNNYFKNALAEASHLDLLNGELPKDKVILPDGTDRTELVENAVHWLKEHSF